MRQNQVRRSRTERNQNENEQEQTGYANRSNQDQYSEEPVYYTGPPRLQLESPPLTRTYRSSSGRTVTTTVSTSHEGRRQHNNDGQLHSFQAEASAFSDAANGDLPFMRVGTSSSDNQGSVNDHLGNIERMMLNATSTPGQFINTHNILLQQAQQQRLNTRSGTGNPSPLRNKIVYELECCFCQTHICGRAMKAILLADTKVELYSTDVPPSRLRLLDDDRMTQGCNCRIRDTACGTCGNVLGYHVSQPCEKCLEARNNGHFWMFYSETVSPNERADPTGNGKPLYWGSLSQASELMDVGGISKNSKPYECFCR